MMRFRDPRPLVRRMAERHVELKQQYEQGWRGHHELLGENFLPFGGRFIISDRNYGDRRHGAIIDSTPLHAARTIGAGLMSGASSPVRPWFRLSTMDPELDAQPEVNTWLSDVTKLMFGYIGDSNFYHQLHNAYVSEAVFGTSVIILLPDDETLFHAYGPAVGQFYLATDAKGRVNTCYREFEMTAAQVVREFGYENCSNEVQQAFDNENFEHEVWVVHAIEPNDDRYVEGSALKHKLPYRSVYFEFPANGQKVDGKALRDGGFEVFPVLVFRWDVAGEDVYGHSPGMEGLGDAIQLQHEQERKGQVIDYQTRPPLQAPPSVKGAEVDTEPGGVTIVPNAGRESGIRPLFETRLDLGGLLNDIEDIRGRLRRTMFTDLFLMFQNLDKSMTARETVIRDTEKLLMIGPMLERLFDEGLKPAIDLIFYYMSSAGVLPPAPPALVERDLDVVFVSPLAQAQRGIGINSIDRLLQTTGALAGMKPNALDIIDEDATMRIYADMLGVDPDVLRDPDAIAALREARAQEQAAVEQAKALQQTSASMKNAAEAEAINPVANTTGLVAP